MNENRCGAVRRELLRGRRDAAHLDDCSACAGFAASLASVDALLDLERAAAARSGLAPSLRDRILVRRGVPSPAGPRSRRAGLADAALRAAAVAAVVLVGIAAVPPTLLAQEFADVPLMTVTVDVLSADRLAAYRLPRLDDLADAPRFADDVPIWAAAAGAAALFAAGLALAVRRGRP